MQRTEVEKQGFAMVPEVLMRSEIGRMEESLTRDGPLRVLPGTHTMGVLNEDAIHDLSIQIARVDRLVPQGGVLVMRPLIIHASSKSRSEMRRRVLHVEYAASAKFSEGLELALS